MFNQSFLINWINENPFFFFIIMAWSIFWKGLALWRAAKNDHQKWFIALLIINTLGLLEILYLYLFSKRTIKKEIQ